MARTQELYPQGFAREKAKRDADRKKDEQEYAARVAREEEEDQSDDPALESEKLSERAQDTKALKDEKDYTRRRALADANIKGGAAHPPRNHLFRVQQPAAPVTPPATAPRPRSTRFTAKKTNTTKQNDTHMEDVSSDLDDQQPHQRVQAITPKQRKRNFPATPVTPGPAAKRGRQSRPNRETPTVSRTTAKKQTFTRSTSLRDVPNAPKKPKLMPGTQSLSLKLSLRKKKTGGLAYNVENAGFPRGEIEFNRNTKRGEPRIGWNTVHNIDLTLPGKVFFSAHDRRYGGPFRFLSNHFPSKIHVPELNEDYVFSSVEHACQYVKAWFMGQVEPRITRRIQPPYSSRRMAGLVLDAKGMTPRAMAEFVDKFDDFRTADPTWWVKWHPLWLATVPVVLELAISAKFEANVDLKMKLMMTGEYELCYANEAISIDSFHGVGFPAHIAMQFEQRWSENLLGKALMAVRTKIREREPQWPNTFALDYFYAQELSHKAKQKDPAHFIKPDPSEEDAKIAWLQGGRDGLSGLMSQLKLAEPEQQKRRIASAAAFDNKRSELIQQAQAAIRAQRQQKL